MKTVNMLKRNNEKETHTAKNNVFKTVFQLQVGKNKYINKKNKKRTKKLTIQNTCNWKHATETKH